MTRSPSLAADTALFEPGHAPADATAGDLRVLNHFTEQFSVLELARRVQRVARSVALDIEIVHVENPHVEAERHYYPATHGNGEPTPA